MARKTTGVLVNTHGTLILNNLMIAQVQVQNLVCLSGRTASGSTLLVPQNLPKKAHQVPRLPGAMGSAGCTICSLFVNSVPILFTLDIVMSCEIGATNNNNKNDKESTTRTIKKRQQELKNKN
eukprot:m.97500 g.97500  ORF g.97500 m.97500 type:complete len:123 (-) comp22047_c0_seq1:13-381(-)